MWNEEALIASKEIILCEALIDALTFWCAGYRNVTSQLRRERLHRRPPRGLPEARHGASLHRLRPRRGGRKRAAKHAEELIANGHRVFPGAVSAQPGRNEFALRPTRREVFRHVLDQRGVAGKGPAATVRGDETALPATEEKRKPEPMKNPAIDRTIRGAPLPEEKPKAQLKKKLQARLQLRSTDGESFFFSCPS